MNIVSVIALIVAAIALIAAGYALAAVRKMKENIEERVGENEANIHAIRKMVVGIQRECDPTERLKAINERLDKLERPMRIAASVSGGNAGHTYAPKPATPKIPKDGFFGAPKGDAEAALFNDQYDELRDECFFSVHYLSATEAEFEPIDLMRLKSLPAIEGVIRYDGCPLKEARGFQLKRKGKVRKQSNYWVVTARAELQMQK